MENTLEPEITPNLAPLTTYLFTIPHNIINAIIMNNNYEDPVPTTSSTKTPSPDDHYLLTLRKKIRHPVNPNILRISSLEHENLDHYLSKNNGGGRLLPSPCKASGSCSGRLAANHSSFKRHHTASGNEITSIALDILADPISGYFLHPRPLSSPQRRPRTCNRDPARRAQRRRPRSGD